MGWDRHGAKGMTPETLLGLLSRFSCGVFVLYETIIKGCDSNFEVKYINLLFINMQFVYNSVIHCQATLSSSYLFGFRI